MIPLLNHNKAHKLFGRPPHSKPQIKAYMYLVHMRKILQYYFKRNGKTYPFPSKIFVVSNKFVNRQYDRKKSRLLNMTLEVKGHGCLKQCEYKA